MTTEIIESISDIVVCTFIDSEIRYSREFIAEEDAATSFTEEEAISSFTEEDLDDITAPQVIERNIFISET